MSWAKVDDRTHEDPRTEAAGVEAMGLWALGLSYMAAHGTDGRITLARCRRLAGSQKGKRFADRLVAAGWWEVDGADAYRLVGWERLLLPRTAAEERSAKTVEAGRKGGQAKAARIREAAEEAGKIEPSLGVRSGGNPPPITDPCSMSFNGNSAKEKETILPTPAHDPDPSRPIPDSAHARAGDPPQLVQREGEGKASPSLVDLCVPPATEERLDPAGAKKTPEERESLQTKGSVLGADPPRLKPEGAARAVGAVPVAARSPSPPVGPPALPGLEDLAKPPSAPGTVVAVWNAYLGERARHLGAGGRLPVLDEKRRAVITRALKTYSLEDVCAAVRGIWRDEFHREKEWKYATVEVALRDAGHVEQFRELGAPLPPRQGSSARPPPTRPQLPPGPPLSPEERQRVLDQYFPGVYGKAAANG